MAKKNESKPIVEEIEVKEPIKIFVLQRDFDSSKYGNLKAGATIEISNKQTIEILTKQKYITNDSK
jgi:hypothetical protein